MSTTPLRHMVQFKRVAFTNVRDLWVAVCSCGWASTPEQKEKAERARDAHLANL